MCRWVDGSIAMPEYIIYIYIHSTHNANSNAIAVRYDARLFLFSAPRLLDEEIHSIHGHGQ